MTKLLLFPSIPSSQEEGIIVTQVFASARTQRLCFLPSLLPKVSR